MKTTTRTILLLLTFTLPILLSSCSNHQYKGRHHKERHVRHTKDESNNYHLRESKKAIEKNKKRNPRRMKKARRHNKELIRELNEK